jgi:hypothetical protein
VLTSYRELSIQVLSIDLQVELDVIAGTTHLPSDILLMGLVGPCFNDKQLVIAHSMKDKVHERMMMPFPILPFCVHAKCEILCRSCCTLLSQSLILKFLKPL